MCGADKLSRIPAAALSATATAPLASPFGSGAGGIVGALFGSTRLADGGRVSEPRTARSDSAPAVLSNQEHVADTPAAQIDRQIRRRLPEFINEHEDHDPLDALPGSTPAVRQK